MRERLFSVVKENSDIPFVEGYSVRAADRMPQWALQFKRRGMEEYKKSFAAAAADVNPKILKFISENRFARPHPPESLPDLESLLAMPMFDVRAHAIVFVDGIYFGALSTEEDLPFSVYNDSLLNTLVDNPDELEGKLSEGDGLFRKLNNAYLTDGVVLKIADGEKLDLPIHVIHVATSVSPSAFFNPRGYIEIGRGASAHLIGSHVYFSGVKCFNNRVLDVRLMEGASLKVDSFYSVSAESCFVENISVEVGNRADFSYHSYVEKAGLIDWKLDVSLGEKASAIADIAADASGGADVSYEIGMSHAGYESSSSARLAAAASDGASVRFATPLSSSRGISGARAEQNSRIILASPDASGRIEPRQAVASEGVKATHGAAVGGFDREALFFLESRGLAADEARALLKKSMFMSAFSDIGDGVLASAYEKLVWKE
ncbi:MAG: SufD family Fe-S cluster assembly protein [Rickettsiales bacterium]|jgi:Fe-S cluster assembly protein SufD|nr:SufD family Fe-S cluster assembly protein [Rickettsiales bacterium]